jgi:hypothetical protein
MNSTTAASSVMAVAANNPAHRPKQHQRRAQALAAGADDVFGDLADQHHLGVQAGTDDGIHRLHVGGDRRVEGVEAQGGSGAGKSGMVGGRPGGVKKALTESAFLDRMRGSLVR